MRVVLDTVRPWRHDLAGCPHACAGTLFAAHGVDPLGALGAGWRFHYAPGDVRREEYYFPCPPGRSLFEALAPYQHATSSWRYPSDAGEGWAQVRERVAAGAPVAVAVDNFHLPFRPAYRDVHTNHLIVVYGFDDQHRTVRVLDAIPPSFDGDLRLDDLADARGSTNPAAGGRDMFFTDNPIANRWLDVRFDHRPDPAHAVEARAAEVAEALHQNLLGFAAERDDTDDTGGAYVGAAGQRRFLTDMAARLDCGEDVVDEVFIVAGAALATAALHADWLSEAGGWLGRPALRELGRRVERIAHHWSALR
ncbi:MAG: BtrH N-terminal domain-containing protein, partial [Egibacteraceae bacterium]